MDAIDVVNAVRQRQGRGLINPLHIEGFGGDAPPMPPPPELPEPLTPAEEEPGEQWAPPPSPLIPMQAAPEPARATSTASTAGPSPAIELTVVGDVAQFKDVPVILDESGYKEIAIAILRCAERNARTKREALVGAPPASQPRAGTTTEASPPSAPVVLPKRPRGRPKGSRNKPRITDAPLPG